MTPPNQMNSHTNSPAANGTGQNVFDAVQSDDLEHLTFEELRELPMRLALSFDSSLDQ